MNELIKEASRLLSIYHERPINEEITLIIAESYPGTQMWEKLQNLIKTYKNEQEK